jgi:iron complex transport system permease protein
VTTMLVQRGRRGASGDRGDGAGGATGTPPAGPGRTAGVVVIRAPGLGWSTRVHPRAVVVTVVVLAATFAVFVWSLSVGDIAIAPTDVVASLAGVGDRGDEFVVRTLRLPRGLAALLVGAGFGLSGAIFQKLIRNPLATPDIVGVNAGAAASGVLAVVVWQSQPSQVALVALTGALVTALGVYLLAYRRGVAGYRLVLVGIGITALLQAVTAYLLTLGRELTAQRGLVWLTGSLNGRTWNQVRPMALALAVLLPVTVALARQLRVLELGDDAARGLGTRVELARGGLLLAGAALAGLATASGGPIGFVALLSPQIAQRLTGPARSAGLLPAAACGSLLLVAADLAGRRLFLPTELPVGILTAILGAPYLLLLLVQANKSGSGG